MLFNYARKALPAIVEHSVHLHIAFALHIVGSSVSNSESIHRVTRGIAGKVLVDRAYAGIAVGLILFATCKNYCNGSNGYYRKRKYFLHNILIYSNLQETD